MTAFEDPPAPGTHSYDTDALLRRWHLMAQLTDALETWDGDEQRFAQVAAGLIAAQIGERATVVLLGSSGSVRPAISTVHQDPVKTEETGWLFDALGDDGVRAWAQEFADGDGRVTESLAGPILRDAKSEPRHRQLLRRYRDETNLADVAYAPLRL